MRTGDNIKVENNGQNVKRIEKNDKTNYRIQK